MAGGAYEVSTTEESPEKVYKEEPNKPTSLLANPNQSWNVRVVSMTSKWFRWHQDDYQLGLDFGFNIDSSYFYLSSEGEEVHKLDCEHGTIPIVAIAMICDHPSIRMIPVIEGFNLQSEVYEIELADAERGQEMVGELVKMGCTVVQRPEG
ncbi:MAG: hypothetical protein Q9209_005720 [Squamulea sp. 1 TL-2023]